MVDTDDREEVGGELQECRDGEGEVDGEVEVLDISDMTVKREIDRHPEDYDEHCIFSKQPFFASKLLSLSLRTFISLCNSL